MGLTGYKNCIGRYAMIKESIKYTIALIEDIQKVNPAAYQAQKTELNKLVQHMREVINQM